MSEQNIEQFLEYACSNGAEEDQYRKSRMVTPVYIIEAGRNTMGSIDCVPDSNFMAQTHIKIMKKIIMNGESQNLTRRNNKNRIYGAIYSMGAFVGGDA